MRCFFSDFFSPLLWASDFFTGVNHPNLVCLSLCWPNRSGFAPSLTQKTTSALSLPPEDFSLTASSQKARSHCHPSHSQCHWLPPPACSSPPLSLHPLHRSENFLYRSNNPDSDIAWHASPHPFPTLDPPLLIFHRARLLHSPDEHPTSFASSCGYIALEAIRNTGHRESHRHLVDRYDRFTRIHKQNTITLSLHSHHRLRSLLWLPLYSTALAQHNVNPKIDFQSPYWNPISDHAKSFIRRLAALDPLHRPTFQEAFPGPWLTTTTITSSPRRRSLPHPQIKLESQSTAAQCLDQFQGSQQV